MAKFKCPKCGNEDIKTSHMNNYMAEVSLEDDAYSHQEVSPGIMMGLCKKCSFFEPIEKFKV